MEVVFSTLAGGCLAIAGAVVGAMAGGRSERERWRRDLQVQLSRDALAALQNLIRATIEVAYSDLRRRRFRDQDTPDQAALRSRFEVVVTEWNAAMYAVLVGGDAELGHCIRGLDREADALLERAFNERWDRGGFREERRAIGESMARYVDLARARTGLAPLDLTTIWTWAEADADIAGGTAPAE